MSAHPTRHVPTRKETLDEVKAFVAKELIELERALQWAAGQRLYAAELVAEKNAMARVMKFLTQLAA